MGAVFENAGGFVAFGAGEGGTQGEADEGADGNPSAFEGGDGERDPGGIHHGAGKAVFGGFVAELQDLGAGGVGLEEGVVKDGGEVLRRGESVCGEGCGVEEFGSVGEGIRDGQRVQKRAPSARGSHSPRYFLSYRDKDWLKALPPLPVSCAKSSFFLG